MKIKAEKEKKDTEQKHTNVRHLNCPAAWNNGAHWVMASAIKNWALIIILSMTL